MTDELKKLFLCALSRREIEHEISMAETMIEIDGSCFPDCTFEDGYIAALNYVLGRQGSNVREEYEQLISERHDAETETA
ncbi:hypothetical protein [Shewanella algae]|uniref:hypothetical protein n=1 Tax=Shewanella algae TaxID=38313 RepID=UPI0031F51112